MLPLLNERQSTGMYARIGVHGVGMPRRAMQQRGAAAAEAPMRSIVMPSATSPAIYLVRPEAIGQGQTMPAVRLSMSQTVARLVYCDAQASCHWELAIVELCYMELGENGKRYQLHYPASTVVFNAAGRYLSFNPSHSDSAPWRLIRLQQRCNLDHRRVVRTHFFHRICNLARPVETPLCKM